MNEKIYLFLAVMNAIPKWLSVLNCLLGPFTILCGVLMKAQDHKAEIIKHNEFMKKYRIIRKPFEFKTQYGTIRGYEVSFERREDPVCTQCSHESGKSETEEVSRSDK